MLRCGAEALASRKYAGDWLFLLLLLPYHTGALLGPSQGQRRVSSPRTSEGCIHACIHCHGLRLRQQSGAN